MNQQYSPHQIKYFAWDITRRVSSQDTDKYAGVLSEAKVDLNPHQIDAALFAFHSPLSKGAILADEVGLGKTIEAGIILSQFWAENKRHILIVVPASLRSQWGEELLEKFYLPAVILEKKKYDELVALGKKPFEMSENIVICSYQFFVTHADEISKILWDLVVLDEAHKLRNVYMKGNVIGNTIKDTLRGDKKLLLTATPLQNNLKELYGLVSIIDDHYFTSARIFSERYNSITTRDSARFGELRKRLIRIVHRTLRKQVKEYVNYTKRTAIIQNYTPSPNETRLYDELDAYLALSYSYGIPERLKPLMSLQLRKIMASSCYALSFTLEKMISRLEAAKQTGVVRIGVDTDADGDFYAEVDETENIQVTDFEALSREIAFLKHMSSEAKDIKDETKVKELIKALQTGFNRMQELGANRKALIFTQSRRTQEYLYQYLQLHGYEGRVVNYNGTNNDELSKRIYTDWKADARHKNDVTGNTLIDKKQAIVDYFKDYAEIMIATEAGVEGINLQFCSMVVNFDMPWNPQRIEQRIGRCHRYGQKFDVVVINFVNTANEAEKRTYELLNDKFHLFDGVFGSSDEVLGSIENGVDFEKRINGIYQRCRSRDEIVEAFDELQHSLEDVISERINQSKKFLIENFDEDVVGKLRVHQEQDELIIDNYKRHFWNILSSVLTPYMTSMDNAKMLFAVGDNPFIDRGDYTLNQKSSEGTLLRVTNKGSEAIIKKALAADTPDAEITFDLTDYAYRVSLLEDVTVRSGYCKAYKVTSFNQYDGEDRILFCSIDDAGNVLPEEFGRKLLELSTLEYKQSNVPTYIDGLLNDKFKPVLESYKEKMENRSNLFVNEELDKLQEWSQEQITPLEDEIRLLDKVVRDLKNAARKERNARVRLELMKNWKNQNQLLARKREQLQAWRKEFDDLVDRKFNDLSQALDNSIDISNLFKFRWTLKS